MNQSETLPQTNMAPENGWENPFILGFDLF